MFFAIRFGFVHLGIFTRGLALAIFSCACAAQIPPDAKLLQVQPVFRWSFLGQYFDTSDQAFSAAQAELASRDSVNGQYISTYSNFRPSPEYNSFQNGVPVAWAADFKRIYPLSPEANYSVTTSSGVGYLLKCPENTVIPKFDWAVKLTQNTPRETLINALNP